VAAIPKHLFLPNSSIGKLSEDLKEILDKGFIIIGLSFRTQNGSGSFVI